MSNAKIVHLKASQSVFAAAGGRIGLFGYEEEAGTMRFQYGASPTVDVAYAALRNSPNTFSGANTFQTITVRDVIVHNQSGTSQSIGYLHSTSGKLSLITRFDETVDAFDTVTRNDDGTSRNTALRIPRTTATAVNAGGSGGQPWNFTGGVWTGGTQRISSAGRFDMTSVYNSAWAGGGVRPLLTDNAGMGYATDAATFRSAIGAASSSGAESLLYSDFGKTPSGLSSGTSTFSNNTASGLQLAANSIASGTLIRIEQLVYLAANTSYRLYQLSIGPLVSEGAVAVSPQYFDLLDFNDSTQSGTGKLITDIEFIGTGSSIVAHVTCTAHFGIVSATTAVKSRSSTINVDGTLLRYIDIRFKPINSTDTIIRRNRVFKLAP